MITDVIMIICLDYLLILNLPPNGYNTIHVNQWFLTGGDFTPKGHWQFLETFLVVTT